MRAEPQNSTLFNKISETKDLFKCKIRSNYSEAKANAAEINIKPQRRGFSKSIGGGEAKWRTGPQRT